MHWIHVLHVLMHGYAHIHNTRHLYRFYVHHHALGFLRSGITSGSGGRHYLWYLTARHISPVDW